ncbi:MAG: hypothetical protein M3Q95_04300 [Bacteroidota bacterium]|nr:hypothetical protein [Bacteroidota bacterium]
MNALRILEISWLVFGLMGIGLAFYNLAMDGFAAAAWPLLFTLIAAVFYTVRRKQRIAYEKQQHETAAEKD